MTRQPVHVQDVKDTIKAKDALVGDKFWEWELVKDWGLISVGGRDRERRWTVRCTCGFVKEKIRTYDVRKGRSKSCGRVHSEVECYGCGQKSVHRNYHHHFYCSECATSGGVGIADSILLSRQGWPFGKSLAVTSCKGETCLQVVNLESQSPYCSDCQSITAQGRRARRNREADGCFSRAQWEERKSMYGGQCYLCKLLYRKNTPANTIDHVIPLSRGGANWPANLRPACTSCNASKGDKTLQEYQEHIALKDRRNAARHRKVRNNYKPNNYKDGICTESRSILIR